MLNNDKTIKNAIANLSARGWGIISAFIFIPHYIAFLGEEAYGLVSFFATLQSVLQLLGVSLSSTLRREFAAGDDNSSDTKEHKYKMLRSIEIIYFLIAVIIMLICYLGKRFIANNWLNFDLISPDTVAIVVSLMGISIGLQLIGNLWFGCIMGSGHQLIANAFSVGWAFLKSVGSLVICITTRNVVFFYVWHIVVDCIYLSIQRLYLRLYLGPQKDRWKIHDIKNLASIWKYTLGLFAISIVAVINKQFDKTVVSGFLSLSELGAYSLVTTLGSLTLIFPNAVSVAVFTTFTRSYTTNDGGDFENQYKFYSKAVAVVTTCMGAFIAVFASDLIFVWTKNQNYMELVRTSAPWVVLGSTMLGLQEVPFSLALSRGETKVNNLLGIISLPIVCVGTYFAVKNWGLLGAGIAYCSSMTIQTIVFVILITNRFTKIIGIRFLLKNELFPLSISLCVAIGLRRALEIFTESSTIKSISAIVIGFITVLILVLAFLGKKFDIRKIIGR